MATFLQIANLAAAVLLLCLGAAASLSASNVSKRLVALFIAMIGAVLSAATLGVGGGALLAGISIAAAYAALGFALLVRLQETYQSVEADELDAGDLAEEPLEPRA